MSRSNLIKMKIENERILLTAYDPKQLTGLKADQTEMLNLFQQSYSILNVVQHFFAKKQLVSFLSLLELIQILLKKKIIVNASFYEYFQGAFKSGNISFFDKLAEKIVDNKFAMRADKNKIKSIPFFRSLSPDLLDAFLKNASIVPVSAGTTFCLEGAKQRSMLVLVSGQAAVYKKDPSSGKQNKLVVLAEGSVFGEAAFFFGNERSATVVAESDCQVLVIKYLPEIYDDLIKTEKAQDLQNRIWAIQALLKAEMFKSLPQECFDALIDAGEVKSFTPKNIICKQGDPGETCYVLIRGRVNVILNLKPIKILEQGDCFGELALMVSFGKRTASVHTETDGLVLEIHRNHFYKILSENLLLGCEFEKLALKRVAENS